MIWADVRVGDKLDYSRVSSSAHVYEVDEIVDLRGIRHVAVTRIATKGCPCDPVDGSMAGHAVDPVRPLVIRDGVPINAADRGEVGTP